MAGVSSESRAALVELFDRRFAAEANVTISNELLAVARMLDSDGAVRRALTDPSREADQRRGIAARLLEGKVFPPVRELVSAAAGSRWSAERDLADALEHLAVLVAVEAAHRRAGGEGVEALLEDLLRFANVVTAQPEVQRALTEARATDSAKARLAAEVSPSQTPEAKDLIREAVVSPRGTHPAVTVQRWAQAVVERNHRYIAVVTVSAPLDETRRRRLARALSSAFGRELTLDVVVDPEVLGGMKVQVGDEVIDGTMSARVADLDRSVTAS